MVTALVATQIIRITQNAIQLHLQNKKINKELPFLKDYYVSDNDLRIQKEVFMMLHDKLMAEGRYKT
jgi:hypothetical protein